MANESKIEVIGGYLVVTDVTTREEYLRKPRASVSYHRDDADVFYFTDNVATGNDANQQQLYVLGIKPDGSGRAYHAFADTVDSTGSPFASADALEDFLANNTGFFFDDTNADVNLHDGAGNPITSTGVSGDQALDVNVVQTVTAGTATQNLTKDAWGRPKAITDKSVFHGMFTFNVPLPMWREIYNGTERAPTNATSDDGKMRLEAGSTLSDTTTLESFRTPRYQANRGHLYSTAGYLPDPTADGVRRFGVFTEESGAFFELTNAGLFAVVRTTVGGVTTDDRYAIDTTGIDLSKGNTFDIQFEWRGVGDYFFYINLDLKYTISYIGTTTELTMFNPANPASFECINQGDNVVLEMGCIDITSEGGEDDGKIYGSIGISNQSGQVSINGFNVPIIAVRSKTLIGSLRNTRDTLALLLSGYADQRALLRVWATRDFSAITENDQSWSDFGDGHLEYIEYDNPNVASPMTFDTTKATLVFGCRVDQDTTYSTSALFEGRTDIYLHVGDMFIFTLHRENGGNATVGATFEFAEAI